MFFEVLYALSTWRSCSLERFMWDGIMTLWDECFGPLNLRGFLSFPSSIWWVSRWVFKPYRLLTHAVSAIFLGGWEFALKNFQEHKHCKYNVSGVSASCSLKSTKQVVSSSIVGGDNGWIELNWLDTARKQHRALLRDHTVLSPNYSCPCVPWTALLVSPSETLHHCSFFTNCPFLKFEV